MNKLFKSLAFPAISILIIAMIYGGLTITNLNNKSDNLQKQNQTSATNVANLQSQLNQLQSKIDQTLSLNDNLQQSLSFAQKQISGLQTRTTNKTASSVIAEPAVITKTITQTVDHQVTANQAALLIDGVGNYRIDIQTGDTAFDILIRANNLYGLNIKYDIYTGMGALITSIKGISPDYSKTHQYWAFYYNGSFSMEGISLVNISQNDTIEMRLVTDTF